MLPTAALSPRRWQILLVLGLLASPAGAANPKEPGSPLEQKAFFRPELYISSSHVPLEDVLTQLPNRAAWEGFRQKRRGQPEVRVFIDPRSGAASSLIGSFPLLPGDGVGNRLRAGRGPVDGAAVAKAVRRFIESHRRQLGIDILQLGLARTTQVNPDLWQVSIPQEVNGVRVRDARLAASISHGNLVVIGTETWGDVGIDSAPRLQAEEALSAGFGFADGRAPEDVIVRKPALEIVPLAPPEHQQGEGFGGPIGAGYAHRLVWTFVFERPPDGAQWEVMVDAHSGEVISFLDRNQYAEQQIKGGVYPITSTGICPNAAQCGTMQSGWPMPFADTGLASPNNFTNSAGVFNYAGGSVTTKLTGKHVGIVDNCGAVNESSGTGTIDLGGTNNQHDCATAGASGGDTPASRSAFYEVNRVAELARGWLPNNTWLQGRLTTNVNINQTCNAFWNGTSINFYRSGGGCRNTGEIAGVFDHEWGHGLDDNDAGGSLSNSSEGYADIAAIYRLRTSCVGHGFFETLDDGCGRTVDGTGFNSNEAQVGALHCDTDCSGVRDADYLKHNPSTPDTALGFVCSQCQFGFPPGPCGKQVHCAAAPSRQAAWDFAARDLQAAPFSLDKETAFIVANKIFYQGSGNIGSWHACTCGSSSSGCGSTNAYMQWLTADDDNGNLNDGTPHMTALHAAFNRHGIACATPTPQNSGCGGGPTVAPSLTATPGNFSVALSWNTVAGATRYWVFRTEGHAGCDFGKTKIAEVTGLSYTDTQVANGRTYYYNVVAAGASSACFGRASGCVSATPAPATNPDFTLSCSPASLSVVQGSSGTSTCTVSSQNGFANPVDLSCNNLPAGVSCTYAPNPATPPANGSVNSTLTVAVGGSTATGSYTVTAQGSSGALTRTFNLTLQVTAAPVADFAVSCSPSSLSITQGGNGTSTCTVTSQNGFTSAVSLSCTGLPAGATCGFNPNPVTPPANGSANSTLTLSVATSTPTGTYPFQVQGVGGSLTRTFGMSLQVNAPTGTVFFDNFETNQGWAANPSGTDTATTGQWARGDPQETISNGVKQLGTTVSGVNDLVTGPVAGNSAGVHDIDGGVTSIRSPQIALPSGALTLTFSYYLAHGSNSSTADFLRVKIVGSTTTTVFEELGAANNDNGAWATHTASLNAFAGQTVHILIEAADASTASLVEAGVDDVKITQP